MKRRQFLRVLAGAGLGTLAGCAYPPPHHGPPPPPPRAPAHGYVYTRSDGTVLVYDVHLGVYTVRQRPNYYFYDGWYWRPYESGWQISVQIGGPWHPHHHHFHSVPPGLVERYRHIPPGQRKKYRW